MGVALQVLCNKRSLYRVYKGSGGSEEHVALIKPLNWGEWRGGRRGWEGHLSGADQEPLRALPGISYMGTACIPVILSNSFIAQFKAA